MRLGAHEVGDGHQTYIVAEVGINHQGDVELAMLMAEAAAKAGASAVKIQSFSPECFVARGAKYKGESQSDLFSRYTLTRAEVSAIAGKCRQLGLGFFGTPDCPTHAAWLLEAGAVAMKVGSDDLTTLPLIEHLAHLGLPLILSTGMATEEDILRAIYTADSVAGGKLEDLILMHCVSLYPTQLAYANIRRMLRLAQECSVDVVGYSDHTDGIEAVVGSVYAGASIIETHFTLDRSLNGPDHAFSKDPAQFAEMVRRIRQAEMILGHGDIEPSPEEKAMRDIARRYIVAAADLSPGTTLISSDLAFKRTPTPGLLSADAGKIIGKVLRRFVSKDEPITEDMVCP